MIDDVSLIIRRRIDPLLRLRFWGTENFHIRAHSQNSTPFLIKKRGLGDSCWNVLHKNDLKKS